MSESESQLTVDVEAYRKSPTRTTVEARDFERTVDEPEEMGGANEGPNPLEYLLMAQAGCLNVTGQQIASEMDIDITDLEITIEGDFNQAAFAGKDDDRTGLQDISVSMEVDADADEDTVKTWAKRVEERCPVSDNIKNETAVELSVNHA
jgi:uncharacterized OsmC-like protein